MKNILQYPPPRYGDNQSLQEKGGVGGWGEREREKDTHRDEGRDEGRDKGRDW